MRPTGMVQVVRANGGFIFNVADGFSPPTIAHNEDEAWFLFRQWLTGEERAPVPPAFCSEETVPEPVAQLREHVDELLRHLLQKPEPTPPQELTCDLTEDMIRKAANLPAAPPSQVLTLKQIRERARQKRDGAA